MNLMSTFLISFSFFRKEDIRMSEERKKNITRTERELKILSQLLAKRLQMLVHGEEEDEKEKYIDHLSPIQIQVQSKPSLPK